MQVKAIILCAGEHPLKEQISKEVNQASLFIAADGGAETARTLGLRPDVIIGDLDSYQPTGEETAELVHEPDQETNDLEKALSYAKKRGASEVTIYGATGKRLDHTLKNLSVLLQFNPVFSSIRIIDRFSTIRMIESPFRENFPLNTSVSLFPLSGRVEGITTKGLKYPLTNGILENGIQDGSSNETVKNRVEIDFKKGDLLLIINNQTDRF
jgi:thiamine pyrophosphokinase